MDYSELVFAIREGDMKTANERCAEATPILINYLISTVNASREDAEDAVQRMFVYLIPKIQNDEINSPSGLLSYMLTGVRHSYYKIYRDYDFDNYEEIKEELVSQAEQAWNLINREKESILQRCLSKLKNHYRDLMEFLFDHPEAVPEDIAEHFDISLNNAWTRKHRALQQMNECVKKFFSKKL
jgi:RNA polymerase sigma factor (sigma-70 family)